jgi:hypothetical protein
MAENYLQATDVMTPQQLERAQHRLGGHREVITFERGIYARMNDTEMKLGRLLTYEIRQAMLHKDVRQVYVPGARRDSGRVAATYESTSKRLTRQQAADVLLEAGHPVQAVADALGIRSKRTLYNWDLTSTRGIGAEGHVEDREIESLDDAQLVVGVRAVAAVALARGKKAKKRKLRLGSDAANAVAKLAQALEQDVDKVRRRCAAAAAALHDMRDMEITQ